MTESSDTPSRPTTAPAPWADGTGEELYFKPAPAPWADGAGEEFYFKSGFITGVMYAQRKPPRHWYETSRHLAYTTLGEFITGEEITELWQALSRISARHTAGGRARG